MGLRSAVARHPLVVVIGLLLFAGVLVFVLLYFEPQKALIDERVDEAVPSLAAAAGAGRGGGAPGGTAPKTPSIGEFRSYEHSTAGEARVIRLADGSRFLRFEGFETSNGPDLRVYLSATPAAGPGDAFDDEFVELGELKGNVGDQNYDIPADLELRRFHSAVVWCKRFSVPFGAAPVR